MKVLCLVTVSFLVGCSFCADSILHNISRAYQKLFAVMHYDYEALYDSGLRKELSWNEKIVCQKEYATDEVMEFLRSIERQERREIVSNRKRVVGDTYFGNERIVIKSMEFDGFFSNIFRMGMGVNVWNNAQFARKMGIPVLKPIAFVEKRRWNHCTTFVLYRFEGKSGEKEIKQSEDWFSGIQKAQERLSKKYVIHDDLRIKNIVRLEGDQVQFIDIDKIHWYPTNSVVFLARMAREVRKFNQNLLENTKTGKKLQFHRKEWGKSVLHNLMCLYRKVFMITHYEYVGLHQPEYKQELSWRKKIFCRTDYATDEVMQVLRNIEVTSEKNILWDHWERKGYEAFLKGQKVIIKEIQINGFMQNLLRMGTAVNIWNNAHYAKQDGIPVLKPIALIEKRKWNQTKTYVVYLYEGETLNEESAQYHLKKIEDLKNLLRNRCATHHDFQLRNIVLLEDGTLQFIDIDKMHWYPKGSFLFRKKITIEEKRFHSE